MITESTCVKTHQTIYVRIPPQLAKYLNLEGGEKIQIQDEEGKHGKYISVWKDKNE